MNIFINDFGKHFNVITMFDSLMQFMLINAFIERGDLQCKLTARKYTQGVGN